MSERSERVKGYSATLEANRSAGAQAADTAIPISRLVGIETRKMFDTRAGLWLMISIAALALLATLAVLVFADDASIEFSSFGAAVGVPIGIILPVVAILAVTSEWSQRTGLVTFTLEPRRERILLAKGVCVILVGIVSIVVAFAIGALGNVIGAAVRGVDQTWDYGLVALLLVSLGNVLALLLGFAFGLLFRSSPGAIVAYFVWSFVVSSLSQLLAANQSWYADLQGWVDYNFSQSQLFNGDALSGEQWAQLATSGLIWFVLPLAIGIWAVLRAEIK
ncbi:MAG: ABC transporter permease [Geodermatophilaceae bacterium]